MKSNTLDKIFKEGLQAGTSPVDPEVWSRLSVELDSQDTIPKQKSKTLSYIGLVSAAAILLFLVLIPSSRPDAKQLKIESYDVISNLNLDLAAPMPLDRKPQGYSKEIEVRSIIAITAPQNEFLPEIMDNEEEYLEDEIKIKVDAFTLLNAVEREMSLKKNKIKVLAVNPKTLLEEAERNSKGNQFGKNVLEKVKIGLKEIETRIVKKDDE